RVARHVELDRLEPPAGLLAQPGRRHVALLTIARRDQHVPAVAGEHARDLLPDAAIAAGDERRPGHTEVYATSAHLACLTRFAHRQANRARARARRCVFDEGAALSGSVGEPLAVHRATYVLWVALLGCGRFGFQERDGVGGTGGPITAVVTSD